MAKPSPHDDELPLFADRRLVQSIRLVRDAECPQTTEVAEEVPIALRFQGFPHVVLMGTPLDIEDLAVGFALTDGICRPGEIGSIAFRREEDAIVVDIALGPDATARFLARRRDRSSRSYTSCGVCGIRDVQDLPQPQPITPVTASKHAIRRALQQLPALQTLNRATGAVHAAAWAYHDGTVALVREDVGRHTALDKLIGARARGAFGSDGFCVVTSRCSFEMVQKATAADMSLLVCISAPTALAIAEAERAGLSLIALARADSQTLYVGSAC